VHFTIDDSPFAIVYDFNPLITLDLISLLIDEMISFDDNKKAYIIR
jgi:hypothetical protein